MQVLRQCFHRIAHAQYTTRNVTTCSPLDQQRLFRGYRFLGGPHYRGGAHLRYGGDDRRIMIEWIYVIERIFTIFCSEIYDEWHLRTSFCNHNMQDHDTQGPDTSSGDMSEEYDLIVEGTGLIESIVACAAAKCGKSLLQIDANDYYGRNSATFPLGEFLEWSREHDITKIDYTQ